MEMLREWDDKVEAAKDQFFPHPDLTRLRMRLMDEEHKEVREELVKFVASPANGDRPALAKELADLLYVVYGTGSALGIDLDEAFRRVHASNMSKLQNGVAVTDSGGKVIKGESYRPPDMSDFGPVESTCEDDNASG